MCRPPDSKMDKEIWALGGVWADLKPEGERFDMEISSGWRNIKGELVVCLTKHILGADL